jgi:hypothetical protein
MIEPILLDWVQAHYPDLELTAFQKDALAHTRLPDLTMITPWKSEVAKIAEWELITDMIDKYTAWKKEREEKHE